MNEAQAFLHTIHERPDDDSPRLMYADWLMEHGQADRGEFIHVQCELVRMEPSDLRIPDYLGRERDLQAEHSRTWAGPLLDLVTSWTFRRGFIEAVAMQAQQFRDEGEPLFRTEHPVRDVHLLSSQGLLGKLTRECALLARLDALDLRHSGLTDDGCEHLAQSLYLSRLRKLCLSNNVIAAAGVASLVDSWHLAALESLDLSGNRTYFVYRGSKFLGSPGLRRIRALHLGLTGLGDEGVQVLAQCVHLSDLRTLAVPNTTLTNRAVRALVSSPYLTNLEELDLSGNHIEEEGTVLLAEASSLRGLRTLRLHNNAIGDEGAKALASSPNLEGLRLLTVGSSSINERGQELLRNRFGKRFRFETGYAVVG